MIATTQRFEILVDGPAFWSRMQEDLADAQESVLVQTLSFEGDVVGKALATALQRSQCRDRRVIVDSFTRYFQSDRFIYAPRNLADQAVRAETRETGAMLAQLEADGVAVKFTNAAGFALHRLPARNHKKLVLIDGRIAYVGGINFCEHNFAWHDMMLRIDDAAVAASLVRDFNATWHDVVAAEFCDHENVQLLNFDGQRNEHTSQRVLQEIAAAREHIEVISPYMTFPFTDALRAAVQRGVHVTVLSPAVNNRGFLATYMHAEAARSGFDLRLYRGRMSHMKAMLIDDAVLLAGSSNFDWLTYHILGEIVMIVRDAEVVAAFKEQVLNADLVLCTRPEPAKSSAWKATIIEGLMKIAAHGARRICRQRIGAAPRSAPQLRWLTRIALFLLLACTQTGWAQRTAAADSAWQAGLQAGTAAAREVPTGGYLGGAFLSGWTIGFGAPFLFASDAPVGIRILPMAGLGGMIATSQSAKKRLAALPREVEQELTMHDSAYSTAFRAEYRRTLTSRLQSAQAIGGVTGILVGLGSLVYLVASSISD